MNGTGSRQSIKCCHNEYNLIEKRLAFGRPRGFFHGLPAVFQNSLLGTCFEIMKIRGVHGLG